MGKENYIYPFRPMIQSHQEIQGDTHGKIQDEYKFFYNCTLYIIVLGYSVMHMYNCMADDKSQQHQRNKQYQPKCNTRKQWRTMYQTHHRHNRKNVGIRPKVSPTKILGHCD